MSNFDPLLSSLGADSLRFFTETRMVHLDEITNPEVEQTYLTINGTPEGYRWLASLFSRLADSAESNDIGTSVIVSPQDLKQITMTEWSSLDLGCRKRESQA